VKINGHVLVVDDDMGCGRLLALLIRHLGYNAEHVDSGGKALEYLSNCKPDLVILDVMMPDIDGLEVLRRMRENSGRPRCDVQCDGRPSVLPECPRARGQRLLD